MILKEENCFNILKAPKPKKDKTVAIVRETGPEFTDRCPSMIVTVG